MSDYLTPQERETAASLIYIKHVFPEYWPQFSAVLERRSGVAGLSELYDAPNTMEGWGKFKKKLKKAMKKLNPVYIASKALLPKKVQEKLHKFEQKHRAEIKKIGTLAAVVAGGYAFAPGLMSKVGSLGKKSVISKLGNKVLTSASVEAKAAVGKLMENIGGPKTAANGAAILSQVEQVDPQAAADGAALGDELADYVRALGKEKVNAIVGKYLKPGETITDANDPRLTQIAVELQGALNDAGALQAQLPATPDVVTTNAAIVEAEQNDAAKVTQKGSAAPYIIGLPLLFTLLS